MEVEELKIEADKALLFDKNYVVWGEMFLQSRRRDNSTDNFVAYSDKFLEDGNTQEKERFEKFVDQEWPKNKEDP